MSVFVHECVCEHDDNNISLYKIRYSCFSLITKEVEESDGSAAQRSSRAYVTICRPATCS